MIKSKILFSAVPFMALGTMFSLTACSKNYDLVIYNWEDYIFEGSKDAEADQNCENLIPHCLSPWFQVVPLPE